MLLLSEDEVSERDPMIGRVLHGTIEIKRLIGAGGMGNVYEGYQEHLERKVAVKVMTPQHARNPMSAEYFIREAKSSSRLRHPNIIQIIDYGKEGDDTLFIAMEFVPGRPLSSLLDDEWPLSTKRVVSIMTQTLAALEVAHTAKVVHRDLKPDNLMIEKTLDGRDFVKVLDFGIAQTKAPGSEVGPLTMAGALVGTPHYMSPEQAQGDSVDWRSDLFSMGVILYEMLTNQRPFVGKGVPQILISVINSNPPSPSGMAPDAEINPDLEAVCLRAIRKEPDLRYQTATEFREALEAIQSKPQPKPKAPPAQFIFKRSSLKSAPDEQAAVIQNSEVYDDEEDIGTMAVQPKQLAERSESLNEYSEMRREVQSAETQAMHGALGGGESEVVDIAQLFSGEHEAPAVPDSGTDLVWEMDGAQTPAPSPPGTGFGINVDELRQDLIGEKRQVAALVVHQRMHKRLDSETLVEVTEQISARITVLIQKWGGVLHSRQGSFTTILFGLPDMAADDAFRAAQAALELRAAFRREAPKEMAFAYAVSFGEVFCPSGEASRAAGVPLDDASDAVHGVGDHEVVAVGDLTTKLESMFRLGPPTGRGERAILGIVDVAAKPQVTTTDLVGRDSELAVLLGFLGRISRESGGVAVVTGEPGMGKSALIGSACSQADQRGMLTLKATYRRKGPEAIRSLMLQWLHDIALHFGRVSDFEVMFRELGLSVEYTRVLSGFMSENLADVMGATRAKKSMESSTSASAAIQVSFRALLRVLLDEQPLVLVIDQVTNYDEEFARFLSKWGRFAEKSKLGFIVGLSINAGLTFPDFPPDSTQVHLDPLVEDACRAYLRSKLPKTVSPQLQSTFVRLSAGIPLHLEQLVAYAKSTSTATVEDAENWLSKAGDISSVLQLRLFGLSKPEQNTLALLSTLGNNTLGEVLLDLASVDWKPEEVLQTLYQQGIINIQGDEEMPVLEFNPPVFQKVIYSQLSRKMRSRIHSKCAEYFEQRIAATRGAESSRDDRIALVGHLEAIDEHRKALANLEILIDACLTGFEYESAQSFIARAIENVENAASVQPEEAGRLKLQMVRIYAILGRMREAVDLTRQLDRQEGLPPKLELEVRLELASLWLADEDPDLVERLVRRSIQQVMELKQANPSDSDLECMHVRALQLMGTINERQGRSVQAAEQLLQAIEISERGAVNVSNNPWGPRLVWEPLNQLGRVRLRAQELAGAGKMFDLALKVAQDADDPRGEMATRGNQSSLLAQQNRLDAASRAAQNALKLARRTGDLRAVAKLRHNYGQILLRQKRPSQAQEEFEASMQLSEDLDWREGIAMNSHQLQLLRDQETKPSFMKP